MHASGSALHGTEGGAPHTGTTIVACNYKGGVVIGADGRVSVGNYISNRASNKITPLTDNVFLLRSGSAPDTQAVADYGEPARRGAPPWMPQRGALVACRARVADRCPRCPLAAVRYFAHQLQAEQGGELSVETVANLVRQVGAAAALRCCCRSWR
jgi:hypothetical protein